MSLRRYLALLVEDALWRLDRARLRRVALRRLREMKAHDERQRLVRDAVDYLGADVDAARAQLAHADTYAPDRRDSARRDA